MKSASDPGSSGLASDAAGAIGGAREGSPKRHLRHRRADRELTYDEIAGVPKTSVAAAKIGVRRTRNWPVASNGAGGRKP